MSMLDKGRIDGRRVVLPETFRTAAGRAVTATVRAGADAYGRARDLPTLIRVDPSDRRADTPEGTELILSRLERALRAERNRARAGHWTYDLNRHIALRQAWLAETERLAAVKRVERAVAPTRGPD
jgi:hypothetical protein